MKVKDINNLVLHISRYQYLASKWNWRWSLLGDQHRMTLVASEYEPKTPRLSQFSLESLPCRLFMGEICVFHSWNP